MDITFLGATGTVTGSKYLVNTGTSRFFVDCGLFQGLKPLRLRNWEALPVKLDQMEAVVLTHAHLDHSGYIPLLVKKGFRGKIYCSPATFDLCQIMLPDSGHLQEEDAYFAGRKGFSKHTPPLPLYTEADAVASLKYFETVPYHQKFQIDTHTSCEFLPAGHILGACLAKIQSGKTSVVFSGDLGRSHDPILFPPAAVSQADYVVVESTYGDRIHEPENAETLLAQIINQTVGRGGSVIIPAFAVGRTQLLIYLIQQLKEKQQIPNVPVFLDSPLAIQATDIFHGYPREHRLSAEVCQKMATAVQYIHNVEESKKLDTLRYPMILISASGMATGGRVIHHLKVFLPDPKNTVLLVGYQAQGTRGASLLGGAAFVKIHGEMIPVKARVASIENLSAHADSLEIVQWLKNFKAAPQKVFVTHGEPVASAALKQLIQSQLGWECLVPEYLQNIHLD